MNKLHEEAYDPIFPRSKSRHDDLHGIMMMHSSFGDRQAMLHTIRMGRKASDLQTLAMKASSVDAEKGAL